jgi:hypothetical protein
MPKHIEHGFVFLCLFLQSKKFCEVLATQNFLRLLLYY